MRDSSHSSTALTKAPGIISIFAVGIWFTVVCALGASGAFTKASPYFLSWLQTSILAPMVLFWILYAFAPPFRRYIHSLDLIFLTALQCLRVLGLAIMVIWAYGLLPGAFAIPMSILDASVGLGAVYAVWMMAHKITPWRSLATALHSWGFIDFIVTIALAMFAMKSLPIDPPVALGGYATLTQTPLSLFPSFAIPFFSCAHFAALIQIARLRKEK